jgi:Ca2+-binding RTX toxin-like protein
MRKIVLVLSTMAAALLLVSGVTLADHLVNTVCPADERGYCEGTEESEHIYGTDPRDYIYAYGGDDHVDANAGDGVVSGDADNDTLYGGEGGDRLDGADGNDKVFGAAGPDELDGYEGDETISTAGRRRMTSMADRAKIRYALAAAPTASIPAATAVRSAMAIALWTP